MALAWVLIILPLNFGGDRVEIPYSFSTQAGCVEIAQWLYKDREFRCVQRPLQSQFAEQGVRYSVE